MTKIRILLLVVVVGVTALIFLLPKVVVEGEENQEIVADDPESTAQNSSSTSEGVVTAQTGEESSHSESLPSNVTDRIASLRNSLLTTDNEENSIIFADSLALLFKKYNKYDSAAKYTRLSQKDAETVGDAYYDAFTFAVDAAKARKLASEVRRYYEEVLNEDASRLDLKTRIAMTYVSSENPMQGILMLREVIEQDPSNEEALFNLGVLSIQSGQYDKAVNRFQSLLDENPNNMQAMFYLGMSYYNSGNALEAKKWFEKVKNNSEDEQLLGAVDSYLSEL